MVSPEKKMLETATESKTWHDGFMKKPRTPRHHPLHVVPEIETDEFSTMMSEEQCYYQVPVFDTFSGELYPTNTYLNKYEDPFHYDSMNGLILPSDFELAEFAADMEAQGMVDCILNNPVKVKDETCEVVCDYIHDTSKKSVNMLKLDYDGIIAGWDDDKSPWTTGNRPELDPDEPWPHYMGPNGCHYGDIGAMTTTRLDVGREARVSRYREKRHTRLFSKKIRYEVRKLNAEKRPRMNGRFVKRTSFVA